MPLSQRDQDILDFEEVQAELDTTVRCINCGWKGTKLNVLVVSNDATNEETCPSCHHTNFLLTDKELDQMHRTEELCPF